MIKLYYCTLTHLYNRTLSVAPEVNEQNEFGYDKSIDMWALGVVVYVTLSGTFPFNTAEDRRDDKINNDHFMFPADLWGSTSPDAIDVIRRLLKTKVFHLGKLITEIISLVICNTRVRSGLAGHVTSHPAAHVK